jgi:type IV fimbrial biogenesis protein FimT
MKVCRGFTLLERMVAKQENIIAFATRRRRHRGFTLIELMITLVLAAIIVSLATPSFQNIIQNNRAATQSNELLAALSLARSEAVKRGARVSLCPSTNQTSCTGGTNWADGWIAFRDTAANDAAAPVVDGDPIRVWGALRGGATLTGPANIRFRPMGDVINADVFEHRVPGCSGDQGRDIAVNIAGRAMVTRVAC